jgi:hypothetical protein
MPWLQHHSLALHVGGGTSGGSYPGKGAYYVGGFVDLPFIDTIANELFQGAFVLRGYPPVAEFGRNYSLFNAEYRFPIVNIDHGPSTLPVFLNRITGTAFVDTGSAFDNTANVQFKTGTGGELLFETTLGYVVTFVFRVGYAHGIDTGATDKVYWVASFPY